jgi:hypothetical protein
LVESLIEDAVKEELKKGTEKKERRKKKRLGRLWEAEVFWGRKEGRKKEEELERKKETERRFGWQGEATGRDKSLEGGR